MPKTPFDAVIFDLDGVITTTAELHSQAWTEMFNTFLHGYYDRVGEDFEPFTHQRDYLPYVDGKPRYQGVESFLKSRGIVLPFGEPADLPGVDTVCGLGNFKNQLFNQLVNEGKVNVFDSTVDLIRDLRQAGISVGVASSSKNCKTVLESVGLLDLFDTSVDGIVSAELGLNGKPEPDIFTFAADQLGAPYDRSVVVEDAISGVQAGRAGNFGLVLGVAREENGRDLQINGADLVVKDLSDISLDAICEWFETGLQESSWCLQYYDYDPEKEATREALLTIGNGFMGTRGAFSEQSANGINYPGTYLAGVYNRLSSWVAGRSLENEDLVNCPNWLPITFRIDQDDWLDLNAVEILDVHRKLDFRSGLLVQNLVVMDNQGRKTRIETARVSSMAAPHLAGLRYSVTPLNYEGRITIRTGLDGEVINAGVARYRELASCHLDPVVAEENNGQLRLKVITNQSGVEIAEAAQNCFLLDGEAIRPSSTIKKSPKSVYASYEIEVSKGSTLQMNKLVAIFHSCETTDKEPLSDAGAALEGAGFDDLALASAQAWEKIWDKVDIQIEGDRLVQKLIRLHLYHSFVSYSPNNVEIDVGILARGLHGEAYRGHIFWDELFILPIYILHFPEIARSVLMYRYRRLDQARTYAAKHGYRGAMFPWQGGSKGQEETPDVHLNPLSGEWGEDHSSRQRHVSIAIAYNIWEYYWYTQDANFMARAGAEMFLEISRFWASIVRWDPNDGKFHITGVMGPDEYHEKVPGAKQGGLPDNAYTNIMVSWCLQRAFDLLDHLPPEAVESVLARIGLMDEELDNWGEIIHNLNIPQRADGVLEQYDGFFDLKELDWAEYRKKYGKIARMDRILDNEGQSTDDYQVLKQADTLMALYNLDYEEVGRIVTKSGGVWSREIAENNFRYYLARTSHGSTLSRLVHSYLAYELGEKALGWSLFLEALISDVADIQGGTTGEGIHTGVMAGTVYNLIRSFAGISFAGRELSVTPSLLAHWRRIALQVTFRGIEYHFRIGMDKLEVRSAGKAGTSATIWVRGKKIELKNHEWKTILL